MTDHDRLIEGEVTTGQELELTLSVSFRYRPYGPSFDELRLGKALAAVLPVHTQRKVQKTWRKMEKMLYFSGPADSTINSKTAAVRRRKHRSAGGSTRFKNCQALPFHLTDQTSLVYLCYHDNDRSL